MNPIFLLVSQLTVLTVDGWAWVKGEANVLKELADRLTIEAKETIYPMFEYVDKNIMKIPRGLVQPYFLNSIRPVINMCTNIVLRPEQKTLVIKFLSSLFLGQNGGILKAPTGTGKTIMGIYILAEIKKKALIIVPTEAIMNQWVCQLEKYTNLNRDQIGIIRGDKCDVEGKSVCIGMIHTLCKNKYPQLVDAFGVVVFDEVHTLGADTFSKVAPLFNSIYRIGLSATPRRKDGMENMFFYHIGPIIAEHRIKNATPNVLMYHYKDSATDHKGCFWKGTLNLGRYVNRVSANKSRNALITSAIYKAWENGYQVLALGDRLSQLAVIATYLMQLDVPRKDIGFITAKQKNLDTQIILATYGSAGMGLDIPRLNCLVFMTPRTDIEQAVGRILRKSDSEKTPLVVDFIDTHSSIMQQWGNKRMKFYDTNGSHVRVIEKEVTYAR